MKFTNWLIKNPSGATAVELALILPLLIALIFGIIEFSLLLYNKNIIAHAAREGARVGVVFSLPDRVQFLEIEEAVSIYLENNLISFSAAAPSVTIPGGVCPESDEPLVVNVDYTYSFLLLPDFLGAFFSGGLSEGIQVSSEAVMICE